MQSSRSPAPIGQTHPALEGVIASDHLAALQHANKKRNETRQLFDSQIYEEAIRQQPPKRKLESRLYLSGEVTAREKKIIETALRECLGRMFGPSGAAAKLGIAQATLEAKIRSLKIHKNRSKPHRGT